jgi:hypothetical protein
MAVHRGRVFRTDLGVSFMLPFRRCRAREPQGNSRKKTTFLFPV